MGVTPLRFFRAKSFSQKAESSRGKPLASGFPSHALNPVLLGGIIVAGMCAFKGILPSLLEVWGSTCWFRSTELQANPIQDSSGGIFEAKIAEGKGVLVKRACIVARARSERRALYPGPTASCGRRPHREKTSGPRQRSPPGRHPCPRPCDQPPCRRNQTIRLYR